MTQEQDKLSVEPDGLLLQTLFTIKQDIGELKQIGIAQAQIFTAHCLADDKMMNDLRELQHDAYKARGAARVWNIVAACSGTILGTLAGYFGRHL